MQLKSLTKAAFILGLGVVAGCDDPEVQDKIASALVNGVVAGEVKCTGAFTRYNIACTGYSVPSDPTISNFPATGTLNYKAQKLQDGTCFVNWSAFGSDIGFIARSNSYANGCEVDITNDVHVSASGGSVTVHSSQVSYKLQGNPTIGCDPYSTPDTVFDMNTQCTGFNFDVFGSP
jgi:hypothetical protein